MPTANAYGTNMGLLTGNISGTVQVLPRVSVISGRLRTFVETITLASQAAGTIFGVARLPKGSVFMGFEVLSTVSLGSSTIAFGNANNGSQYANATTLTSPDQPLFLGKTITEGVPLDTGIYDSVTGLASAAYEDILMTVAAAALPSSGTLRILTSYALD